MTLFLVLVIAAIVLGIIGVAAEGLFYLLVIGIVVLVAALVYPGMHMPDSGPVPAPALNVLRLLRLPHPSASGHPATDPDMSSDRASGERHEGPPAVDANIAFQSPAPSWPLVETAGRKPSRTYGKTPHHAP